ncbi:hypothetical protein PYJP_17610 [Pyrofollis japonicus]|uniref:glycosyltransferase n=1 Tax=Pyrofollis japonicus TaxID=3060460 RepID=UPI00295C252C|nr:glycosyltransferase [Pyrofollis japonicus]BEP18409.1 hypothetical protein PYJP_17610 [Pyrofollis japonicus]
MPRVLFLPSHVGLGHVTRDYAVALALRRMVPSIRVEWCSAEPVRSFLQLLGESVREECLELESFSKTIEDLYNGAIRGLRELGARLQVLRRNYEVVEKLLAEDYDLVFADEFWEAVYSAPLEVKKRIVFGTDILYKPYSLNPVDSFMSLILNNYFKKTLPLFKKLLFLNDPETLRGKRWYGLFGERLTDWIEKNTIPTGYVTSFLPEEIPSRNEARRRLGVTGDELVVVISVGGTSTRSKPLLDCIDEGAETAAKMLRERLGREVRFVAVPGPRTKWRPRSSYIEVLEETAPRLLTYYAAGDVFVTRAGRTTTADLLCLGKPAVLIPIRRHFEQEEIARDMERRFGYPVLREDRCNGERLAGAVLRAISSPPRPPTGLCNGVERTASILSGMLGEK